MGIIKVSDEIHTEVRRVSGVMSRSINAQAEFWLKMGRLAELNPDKTFRELITEALSEAENGQSNN